MAEIGWWKWDIVKKKKLKKKSDLSKLVVVSFLERNVSVVWLFMCESIEMVMVVAVLYYIGLVHYHAWKRERERESMCDSDGFLEELEVGLKDDNWLMKEKKRER